MLFYYNTETKAKQWDKPEGWRRDKRKRMRDRNETHRSPSMGRRAAPQPARRPAAEVPCVCFLSHTTERWGAGGFDAALLRELRARRLRVRRPRARRLRARRVRARRLRARSLRARRQTRHSPSQLNLQFLGRIRHAQISQST